MRILRVIGGILASGVFTTAAAAATPAQPPMNDFNQAFYTCENNTAFIVSYDDNPPKAATLTTSNNNKTYQLKRTAAAPGVTFEGDAVSFWTDGVGVKLRGTQSSYENCKIKPK